MLIPITVVIPVGPHPEHREWLAEAVGSVRSQSHKDTRLLIVDDMAGIPDGYEGATVWRAPWRLGVPHAFNMGVALADTEVVFMLGADDLLEEDCIAECARAYDEAGEAAAKSYFYVGVHYMMPGGGDQYVPCNAAAVSKTLWRSTGGFPPESASGACDAAFVSQFWNRPEVVQMRCVNGSRTLYNYRVHNNTDTASRGSWQGVIMETRHRLTEEWKPPRWGRYA